MKTLSHYLNGQLSAVQSQHTSPVYNPATGEQSAQVALATADETREAVRIADEAFADWSKTSPLKRARILFKFKALVEEHTDELARLVSSEHGKVFSDAKGEVTRGLEVVEFACGIPHLQKGEHSMNVGTGVDSYSMMQPLGVCAGISPFNFPAMVPMWMFPIALACGNTFVMKPSEKDPSTPLRLAELLKEAGLPDGVFNVINGDKEAVDVLLTDERVQAVSFVGSTPIAEYIYATASAHGKRVQALGGAKNHMVIMPDADLDQAVGALMGAAYGSAGERCMAISVAVPVGEETANRLREKLVAELDKLTVGPGLVDGPDNDMGPLITREHREKVAGYIQTGVDEGAELVVDGRQTTIDGAGDGYFIGGSLFDHVTPSMRIHSEEIFGPVLAIARVASFDEAVSMINAHEYGNGTAIFTRNGDAARQYCEQIQVGMVGVNVPIPVPMAFHSFGGWKRSLFGPLHMHGPDGVRFYTRMKTITQRWPSGIREETNHFTMPTM
ncbi:MULTISPECIES: CoA-acylating methylmalonate-semialdehyde dehydrogenase [Halomonadaceae]|jgi:malonate-semialdehyde dehydrogenase (acetylating) / methylmalonate-semialdehyde dehydrogenase|uniref:CoA-acylating methylmalonate-semialdehyde dehydrogenase n=1 Tax=Halomonadaceae TaxID=28256 RepID=UPI0012F3F632|nr:MULTISPECIES: CoA-acylating methylmalonate-semialdehyde dehydrogenase [Halomonas]CAD5259837.1 putative 3-oxopropanoate dehydrogenase [Halomonas sp. 59]CAD5260118.1 putative 3-oxopropanoate dehydrogenase [Halomonas sp. 113]CAD5274111.1 Putative 3-oxopropanoate dehydrogenase [Halomonas sp. I3]CAD5288568.1 putative 3-oxopropanoate dehydrogenase [Halomonas sp. 156]VXB37639.1 putative 3-oxopropanoate dehydrogenase [Halomonas titanicae]